MSNKDFSLKLQNFDIKKNVLGRKKEERKKKNIGYRVASNERRLKTKTDLNFTRDTYRLPDNKTCFVFALKLANLT